MSPEQKRTVNTVFGSIFVAVAALEWSLAAYFSLTPASPRPAPVVYASSVDIGSCRNTLGALGYRVETVGQDLRVYEPLSESPKEQLDKATMAAALCKMKMTQFCMGEGCEQPGVLLTIAPLQLSEARAIAAKPASGPSSVSTGKQAPKKK